MRKRCIAALLVEPAARTELKSALIGVARVNYADSIAALLHVARRYAADVVVLELGDGRGISASPHVASLRRELPYMRVVVYGRPSSGIAAEIVALSHAGIDALVQPPFDELGAVVRRVLDHTDDRHHAQFVLRQIEGIVPDALRPLVRYSLQHAAERPTVGTAAQALRVSRKTLTNWCASAKAPPPSELIGWCQLLLGARLLDQPDRCLKQVAQSLGFPSAAAYGTLFRRLTGLSIREARHHDFATMLELFRDSMGGGSVHVSTSKTDKPSVRRSDSESAVV